MSPSDAIYQARFISFAIAVGILLLCFAPHVVWKYMGQKRATELVKQWEAEDARPRAPGAFIPVWTVRLPGYLSSNTVRCLGKPFSSRPAPCIHASFIYSALDYHNPQYGRSIVLPSGCIYTLGKMLSRFLPIMCADDSSGSMALPTLVPLTAFLRPTKAPHSRLCSAMSRYTGIPTAFRVHLSLLTSVTVPTRMRRCKPGVFLHD